MESDSGHKDITDLKCTIKYKPKSIAWKGDQAHNILHITNRIQNTT